MIRSHPPARVLATAALALAMLIWLRPLTSEAASPADSKREPILPCLSKSGDSYKPRTEPKRCAHFKLGAGVDLHRLAWDDDWGEPKAHGAGFECGFEGDCRVLPATVLAYRIRTRCGRPVYTRLRARTSLGTELIKTRACLGAA